MTTNRLKKILGVSLFGIALAFTSSDVHAQITCTNASPYNTPANLVNNVLMGQGVTALNITSYGNAMQRGFFNNGGSSIGIDSGLVLSSGSIFNIPISSGAGASTAIPNGTGQGAGDADLLSVAQSVPGLIGQNFNVWSAWDASIITFDFVPLSDTVEFDYVFGSDEYTTWINTSYNDCFGFFLSGPGINGSYSNNAINVATVPGTNPALPISISTIHPGLNGAYYNSNLPVNQNLAYNGYTDVMTAVLVVQACDTFKMKLGVADGSDKILDTGVFIKAHSFTSTGLVVQPAPSYNPFGHDTAMYEGCGDVDIYFVRNDSVLPQDTLHYTMYGTAQQGLDYSSISTCSWNPNQNRWECDMVFPAGQDTGSISFQVFNDGLVEPIETLVIAIDDSVQLSCHSGDTIYLTLHDQPDLTINTFGGTTIDCNDTSQWIGVNVTNGLWPFVFDWSNGEVDSGFFAKPAVTTSYTVTVTDACGQQQETDFVTIGVFNVPWSVVKFGDNQTVSCIDGPVTMGVQVAFNDNVWHGDISYQWSTGSTDSTISVHSNVDTNYSVTITRGCTQEVVVESFFLNAEHDQVELTTVDIPEEMIACPGDVVTIGVVAEGGYPPYTYSWSDGSNDSSTVVGPLLTQTYTVTVQDDCALEDYVDQVVVNVPVADPLLIFGVVNDTVPCPQTQVHFGPPVPEGGFGWGYEFSWNGWQNTKETTQKIIFKDEPFTLELTDGCKADTASITVWGVIAEQTDLELLVSGDTTICAGDNILLEAQGINGGDKYKYYWNGSSSNQKNIRVAPNVSQTYTMRMVDRCDSVRIAKVNVDVRDIEADYEFEYLADYMVSFINKSRSTADSVGYYWTIEGGDFSAVSNEKNPQIELPTGQSHTATLVIEDDLGCRSEHIGVIAPEYFLYIPSGFTPNSDNINDKWSIRSLGVKDFRIEVFNRWGERVFASADKNFEWDGTFNNVRLQMGTYAYRIVLVTDSDEYVEREGSVNIMNDFRER